MRLQLAVAVEEELAAVAAGNLHMLKAGPFAEVDIHLEHTYLRLVCRCSTLAHRDSVRSAQASLPPRVRMETARHCESD